MKHFLKLSDWSREEIYEALDLADRTEHHKIRPRAENNNDFVLSSSPSPALSIPGSILLFS